MDAVTLKGRKEGFELIINASADFEQVVVGIEALLTKIQAEQPLKEDAQVELELNTGLRLLDEKQVQRIQAVLAKFPNFQATQLHADVVTIEAAKAKQQAESIHIEPSVLRSGQEINCIGDVLFVGNLHQGATLKASGNIYLLGQVEGVVHAGFPDNVEAVVLGDLSAATQLRIADTLEIIDHKKNQFNAQSLSYVNDLHMIEYGKLADLKRVKPKLYHQMKEQ